MIFKEKNKLPLYCHGEPVEASALHPTFPAVHKKPAPGFFDWNNFSLF